MKSFKAFNEATKLVDGKIIDTHTGDVIGYTKDYKGDKPKKKALGTKVKSPKNLKLQKSRKQQNQLPGWAAAT